MVFFIGVSLEFARAVREMPVPLLLVKCPYETFEDHTLPDSGAFRYRVSACSFCPGRPYRTILLVGLSRVAE
jgi:hypothetical protein